MIDIGMDGPQLGQGCEGGVSHFILGIVVLLQLTSQSLEYGFMQFGRPWPGAFLVRSSSYSF